MHRPNEMRRREFFRTGAGLLGSAVAVGLGGSLVSAPTAAHPGPYEPYGSIDVEGAKEAVVAPDGETAYLATTTGYAAVDVSVPDRPRLLADVREPLADRDGGPLRGIFDVKLDATDPTTLVVAGPANPLSGAISGFLVVDVSDPESPTEQAFHETPFPIHNCFVRDGVAYLTGNDGGRNPLVVRDIESGAELGRWSVIDADETWDEVASRLRSIHDVYVHGSTAFVALWDAGTWILDVSDPASPTVLGTVDAPDPSSLAELAAEAARREATLPPRNHHYVATDPSGTLLGVGRETWALRPAASDATSTATPKEGDVGGATDTTPTPAPRTAATATATASSEYVGGPSGIDLWDVADPADPVPLATIPAPPSPDPTYGGVWTTAHNFELTDSVLYSSWYQGGVKRHDISEPSAPRELSWWRDPDVARFWTARLARPGEREGFFVASSMGVGDGPARLYTFPDHAGQQADPPGILPERTATPATEVSTTASEETTSDDAGATADATEAATDDPGVDIGAPGFGATAAVAGFSLAAWRLLRRSRE